LISREVDAATIRSSSTANIVIDAETDLHLESAEPIANVPLRFFHQQPWVIAVLDPIKSGSVGQDRGAEGASQQGVDGQIQDLALEVP